MSYFTDLKDRRHTSLFYLVKTPLQKYIYIYTAVAPGISTVAKRCDISFTVDRFGAFPT